MNRGRSREVGELYADESETNPIIIQRSYLGSSSVATLYGAAGSLIIILLWVYYSSQILFFGAEFTKVYSDRYGSKIKPAAYAKHMQ